MGLDKVENCIGCVCAADGVEVDRGWPGEGERLLGGGDGSDCMILSLAAAREIGGAYIAVCAF